MSELAVVVENVNAIPLDKARRLRAVFDLRIPDVGLIRECRLLVNGDRRTIAGPSINDAIRGWVNVVKFEDPFIQRILAVYDAAILNQSSGND
jgi:hypothetical protein